MRPSDFESSTFGSVEYDVARGLHWFDPAPLPRSVILEEETLMALSRADAAVGRLDGIAQLLTNPSLIAAPYAAREAVASSRIEGTHATLSEVYETEAGKARAYVEEVKVIRAYTKALEIGLASVSDHRLDLRTLAHVHRALMDGEPHAGRAGQWRDQPVWVGAPTGGPETATFVPPLESRLPGLLEDWSEWHAQPPRLPLLVRVALLHYQFLTIHPFFDGNGRVGRMLIQMILEEEHALSAPLLYVSAYFAKNRREYYDRLQAVRQHGEIQQWLQFFLTAVFVQANDGVERARGLLDLREEYRSELSGTRSRAAEVVDLLFTNPVVSAGRVQRALGMTNQGSLNLLRSLEQREILAQLPPSGRGGTRFWYAPKILGMFDDETEADS
ncbi:MAG: Fic family protein [Propionibacteriaceae bacterium]|nr:Fic family protein [Propionibacteriaceae bacterium]